MALATVTSASSPTVTVYEGDTVLLYCPNANGYLYSDPPNSSFSHVTIRVITGQAPPTMDIVRDPLLPNLQFAAFQIQPQNYGSHESSKNKFKRTLVYGRRVKLFHLASKQYLSIPPSTQDCRSPMAVLVDGSSGTLFQILPGKPGKHRGEDIMMEDTIIFQSMAKKGNHVFISMNKLTSKYELKLGAIKSTFIIFFHSTAEEYLSPTAIKAGELVMLQNVKHELHTSVHGSFACNALPQPIREKKLTNGYPLVFRSQHSAHGIQKPLPTSGDAFWQFENAEDPLSGGKLWYGNCYRIKHLLTQQYLTVVKQGDTVFKVVLKELVHNGDIRKEDVTFILTPTSIVKQHTGGVNKGSYVELKHAQTGKVVVIHAQTQLEQGISVTQNLQSSTYEMVLVDSSSTQESVFKLDEVEESFVQNVYYVTGVATLFNQYMQQLALDQHLVVDELTDTLRKLSHWLDTDTSEKRRAKTVRATKVIDQLVGFLIYFSTPVAYSPVRQLHHELCKLVADVLDNYVQNAKLKSTHYLAEDRFMTVLLSKVGSGIGIETVLGDLVKNSTQLSEKIVMNLTSDKSTRGFLEKLDVPILNLFSVLCFAGGKPVRSLQNSILDLVLKSGKDQLLQITMREGNMVVTVPERLKWINLHDIASKNLDLNQQDLQFLMAQIQLFSRICKGGNTQAKKKIVDDHEYITFSKALIILRDERLHHKLQSHYLDFITSVFIYKAMEGSGTDVDNIPRVYYWDEVSPISEEMIEDVTNVVQYHEEIQDLQIIISSYLKSITFLNPEDLGKNELVMEMLCVVKLLVAYRSYWKKSVTAVVRMLINIIDVKIGTSDSIENNRVVYAVKSMAVTVLHLMFKQYSYLALGRFIFHFKQLTSSAQGPAVIFKDISRNEYKEMQTMLDPKFQDEYKPSMTEVCRKMIKINFEDDAYAALNIFYQSHQLLSIPDMPTRHLVRTLIDLLHYKDDELRMTSARLLFDMHKREEILFVDASASYLATSLSAHAYNDLKKLGSLSDEKKLLVKMQQGSLNGDRRKLLMKLEEIANGCVIKGDTAESHPCYQGIVYSTRVFDQLLDFVLKHHSIADDPNQDIVKKACIVLANCTHRNPTIQKKLFENVFELLDASFAVFEISQLFTEVLTDNAALCRRLSKLELKPIFQLATSSSNPDHYELCTTLQAAIKVSKITPTLIRSSQETVVDMFMKHQLIKSFLMKTTQEAHEAQAMLTLNVIELLSVCAERECTKGRQYCNELFTVEKLLGFICDSSLPLSHRKPYTHLLTEGFINGKMDLPCTTLAKEDDFWNHLNFCARLINSICKNVDQTNQKSVCCVLKILATSHLSIRGWRNLSSNITTEIEDGICLNEALLYIFDGIIPLVTAFCFEFDRLSSSGPYSKIFIRLLEKDSTTSTLWHFAQSIQVVVSRATVFATSLPQVAILSNCLQALACVLQNIYQKTALTEDRQSLLASFRSNKLVTPEKRLFDEQYEDEQCLNHSFRVYTEKFHHFYEGKHSNDEKGIGTGVILPQGPSFQLLVAQFSGIASTELLEMFRQFQLFTGENWNHDFPADNAEALKSLLEILSHDLGLKLTSRKRSELSHMVLTCLQVFAGMLERKVASISRDQDPTSFARDVATTLVPVQDQLLQLKVHEKATLHLHHFREDIIIHVLALLSMLLHFGNKEAQKEIGALAKQQHGILFDKIHNLLVSASSTLLGERPNVMEFRALQGGRKRERQTCMEPARLEQPVPAETVTDIDNFGKDSVPLLPISISPGEISIEMDLVPEENQLHEESEDDYSSEEIPMDPTKQPEVQDIGVVLDVIAWICDGQNREVQEMMREQDVHLNSFNILGQVGILLQGLAESLTNNCTLHTIATTRRALQALIEMCAGNFLNQYSAFKVQVVDSVMNILMVTYDNMPKQEHSLADVVYLKASAIEFLQILLEETDEQSKELAKGLSQDFNTSVIVEFMAWLWEVQKEPELKDEARMALYRAFHVLCAMADYLGMTWMKFTCGNDDQLPDDGKFGKMEMWQNILDTSHCIEVNYDSPQGKTLLTKIRFPFDQKKHMSEVDKEWLISTVIRDNPSDKLTDFLEWISSIRKNVKYNKNVIQKWYIQWILTLSNIRHWTLILVTLLLNLFIMVLYEPPAHDGSGNGTNITDYNVVIIDPATPTWYRQYIPYTVGVFHTILSVWMVVEYFIVTWPNLRLYYLERLVFDMRKFFGRQSLLKPMLKCFCCCRSMNSSSGQAVSPPKQLHGFEVEFLSFNPIYRLIFLLCSLLSLRLTQYWYGICLLYVFLRNNVLQVVLTALRRSAAQLFSLFLLVFVILFMYAIITFGFLHEYFDPSKGQLCDTLGECVLTIMREGLLETLGLGIKLTIDDAEELQHVSVPTLGLRVLLDVSFFIIVTTLGLNIVIAILVDRFSVLREEKDKITEDQQGYCFICAIDCDVFERNGTGFRKHVHEDHNMWNYIYFVLYLDTIFENDRNALEDYIFKKVDPNKPSIEFFPMHRAKVLPDNGVNAT